MRKSKILKVDDILPVVIKRLGIGKQLEEYEVLRKWEKIVGKTVAKRVKPWKIEKGILYLKIKNPMWMQEICTQKKRMIERINKIMEKKMVKEIKILRG